MSFFLKQFFPKDRHLFVTEFGHSKHQDSKTVGPWSRGIYLLHYVAEGYCDFSGFRIGKGQVFLIAKDRLHSFTISNNYEHYWIGVSGEDVGKIFGDFNIEYGSHQLFFVQNPDFVKTLFSDVKSRLENENTPFPDSLVLSLFTSMLPLLKSETESLMPYKINYAERIRMFIDSNYIYPIKMNDIAKAIHLSEKYMYRLFKERFNISPQKYLLKTRMEVAKSLLLQKNISIKEVACMVGYTSFPSFTKAFTIYFGINPSKLRKSQT